MGFGPTKSELRKCRPVARVRLKMAGRRTIAWQVKTANRQAIGKLRLKRALSRLGMLQLTRAVSRLGMVWLNTGTRRLGRQPTTLNIRAGIHRPLHQLGRHLTTANS